MMKIVRSTSNCATAWGGNKPRETLQSLPTVSLPTVDRGRILTHNLTVRKQQTFFVALTSLLVLFAAVALAIFLRREAPQGEEPRFNGRSLSEWLALYESELENGRGPDSPGRIQAHEAVAAMGPKALPFLLQWIQYEPEYVLPMLPPEQDPIHILTWRTERRGNEAIHGFALLGTNALACIPELKSMMRDKSKPDPALRATAALAVMGAPGFPHLTSALKDTHQADRDFICLRIAGMAPVVGTNECLPHLRGAMGDQDPRVREAASRMVARLTAPAVTNTTQ